MQYREEWPLWSVQKKIFGNEVWVELDDVPDLRNQPDGCTRLLAEVRTLEARLLDAGISGWIASVEKGNVSMQRWLLVIGARPYADDATYQYFCKLVGVPEIPARLTACVRQAKEAGRITWH